MLWWIELFLLIYLGFILLPYVISLGFIIIGIILYPFAWFIQVLRDKWDK